MVGPECIVMAAVKSEAATITEYVEALATTMMLDSGSSVSLFKKFAFEGIKLCDDKAYFTTASFDRFWR